LTFLRNHREAIVALDFFTVPTVTFHLLYVFFVVEHSRRKIVHFNMTQHPTAEWVVQQLREAFPEAGPYRYVILDRDSKFSAEVSSFLKATGLKPTRTSIRSPWVSHQETRVQTTGQAAKLSGPPRVRRWRSFELPGHCHRWWLERCRPRS
jgi:hypothetical protein